ncbi:MAG: PASTA domain-containing protein [Candidatus Koribacter versatilis]|uniref:PASTA domain-containing protein n=1 Tax=Candidatus Korobacter versatilis TaxID=658062 RepID=A0A932A987_9BACT|nr:PASTA domain-containing protein [Candidatus Koribacter versatilis]
MKRIFRLFVLALVLLMIGMLSMLTAMRLAIHRSETAVPKLVGLGPDEAERLANSNGLILQVESRFYSNEVAEGKIVTQVPAAGTKVRRGWRVRVAESLGPQRATIPNVVGQSRRAAEMNIARRALELGTAATVHVPDSPPDQVVAQSPMAYASATSPKVNLLINAPANEQEFVMPDFTGRQLTDVFDAADAVGMKIVSQPVDAPGSPPSSVVRQSPAPGTRIASGATIHVEVAK